MFFPKPRLLFRNGACGKQSSLFNSFQHYSTFFRGWPAKTKKNSLPTKDNKIAISGHFWAIRTIFKKSGVKIRIFSHFCCLFFSTLWKKGFFHTMEKKIFPHYGKKRQFFKFLQMTSQHFIMLLLLNKATCSIYILQLKVVS